MIFRQRGKQACPCAAASAFQADMLYGSVMKGNDASAKILEKADTALFMEETGAGDDFCGRGMLVFMKNLRDRPAQCT